MRRLLYLINLIDSKLNEQVNGILHQPEFQRLESAWRGLAYLVQQLPQNRKVKIKFLTLSSHQAIASFNKISDEQTTLFQLIHTQEFDHSGGEPFGVLLSDYDDSVSATFLKTMIKIAEASFCLFITSINLNDFRPEFNASHFAALVVPDYLARPPWHSPSINAKNRWFTEHIQQSNHYCWSQASYLLAAAIINSVKQSGWFQGVGSCPTITKTKSHPVTSEVFTQKQIQHLTKLGYICTNLQKYTGECYFQYPSNYSLESILTAGRFAHYIKVIARDKIGCFKQAQACEDFLQTWILQFCALDNYPLKYAKVQLTEHPTQPEKYYCTITLQPRLIIPSQEARLRLTSPLQL